MSKVGHNKVRKCRSEGLEEGVGVRVSDGG